MAQVAIEMIATLSGDGESWGPGSVVFVDVDEASRLIGLGAAVGSAKPLPVADGIKPITERRKKKA